MTGRSHARPLVAQCLGTEGLCGPHTACAVVGLEEVGYLKFVTSQHWVASWLLLLSPCVLSAFLHRSPAQEVPVNVRFCLEGMEESGSEGLDALIFAQKDAFFKDVDYVCISDNYWLGKNKPCITYGLRGICYFFIEVCAESCREQLGGLWVPTLSPVVGVSRVLAFRKHLALLVEGADFDFENGCVNVLCSLYCRVVRTGSREQPSRVAVCPQVECSNRDLHSGVYGGSVHEAMTDLIMLMGERGLRHCVAVGQEVGAGTASRLLHAFCPSLPCPRLTVPFKRPPCFISASPLPHVVSVARLGHPACPVTWHHGRPSSGRRCVLRPWRASASV